MALIRWTPREVWDPFASLADVQEEMNRLFDTSLRRFGPGLGTQDTGYIPSMDVVEEKDRLLVRCDLPGCRKEDVKVSLQDNHLTIQGERKPEAETKEAGHYRRERVFGSFQRAIDLPANIDAGKIEARFHDGVLVVTLPKSEESKPKQIPVRVD